MENPQESNKKESFGFKPNWGIIVFVSLLVFFGAFLGGLVSSYIGTGIITKKIKLFFDESERSKQKPTKDNFQKSKVVKVSDAEIIEDDSVLANHKKFRDAPSVSEDEEV